MPAALITGASTGIGRDFAHLCAREGYDLFLVARSQPQLESVAAEVRQTTGRNVVILPKDLSQSSAPREVFDEISRSGAELDVLINNAGFGLLGPFWELDLQQQIEMIHLNIAALTELTRLYMPSFVARRRGRVLNVASTAAFQPGPLMAVYYATKAYVVSFSEAIHNEGRDHGVTVTCLCPGPTQTEFQKRAGAGNARLFSSGHVMSSEAVARIGWDALTAGKPLAIAGRLNAVMAFLTRFAPLQLTASMARRFQEQK